MTLGHKFIQLFGQEEINMYLYRDKSFIAMFVRRKTNKSGSLSIYVVDKSRGRYTVVKSFGTVRTEAAADLLENKAREWVREQEGDPETLFDRMDEVQLREYAATLPEGRLELAGPELLYGELFDRLGLGAGEEPLFRHLAICRVFAPGSKLKVRDYLRRYLGVKPEVEEIYRVVDGCQLAEMTVSSQMPARCYVLATALPKVPFCLLTAADGTPVAGKLIERKGTLAKHNLAIQRFAKKYGSLEPVTIVRRGEEARRLAAFFKIGKKDLAFKPLLRRLKGRVEGHLCICLAACAVEHALAALLADARLSVSPAAVRESARTMFRLNYRSNYTNRPKSVLLPMSPQQKDLYDLIH